MAHSSSSGSSNFLYDFLAGGVSGALAKTIAAPIERVKLLLQTQHTNPKLIARPYKGILDCFKRVFVEEGVLSFWRGNWANVIRYFPTQAINFSVKDALNRQFLAGVDPKKRPGRFFAGSLLSGGIAGSIGLLIVYPLDFSRTRLAADIGKAANERQFKGLVDCMGQIIKTDGITGIYQGFGISVVGIFVYRALYFGGYDAGKRAIWGDDAAQRNSSILARFFFAQFVVSTSETLSYPLDTVRRRLMMQAGQKTNVEYSGTVDCFAKIIAKEGPTGFFKGNLSNIWRSVGSSLVLVFYDEFQKLVAQGGKH
ncbi:unnamed protein product [Paramecium octaurelia]|uniref:ADP/ATP translocase n=1 Tax=Paramecium octaurelia TaxID=43137 RepID=A0A8S1SCS2_PAROT|nr:unnamed protein product [Paramecium octaurelia]